MCVNLPSCRFGGARTLDPMIKSHVLYQLSYEPLVRCFGHTKVLLFLKLANLEGKKSEPKGARPVVEEGREGFRGDKRGWRRGERRRVDVNHQGAGV